MVSGEVKEIHTAEPLTNNHTSKKKSGLKRGRDKTTLKKEEINTAEPVTNDYTRKKKWALERSS